MKTSLYAFNVNTIQSGKTHSLGDRCWETLLFRHNLNGKAPPFAALEATRQHGGKNELHRVHLSHRLPRMLHRRWKKGETNGKANQLHEKESCHLSNIHCVLCHSVFFFPTGHIFKIEFWKPYALLTPFMLYQFTDSFYLLLCLVFLSLFVFMCPDLANAVCSWHLFNPTC